MKQQFLNLTLAALLLAGPVFARHTRCTLCARNERGRIARSMTARHAFTCSHPCPSTGRAQGVCPGYVVDHRQALKHGGADIPANMQWQTAAEAKAKDRVE